LGHSTITRSFPVNDLNETKYKVLNWSQRFSTFCFLDNHQYQIEPHNIECLLAAGTKRVLRTSAGNALQQLQEFHAQGKGWLFGHLGYDLKNEIEHLSSLHPDPVGFADLFFFEPEVVIRLQEKEMWIDADDPEVIYESILALSEAINKKDTSPVSIHNSIPREEYISIIRQLQQHILRGDCYEINFCQEFFADNAIIDPVGVYRKLSDLSPNPFSALYRNDDRWLVCASPERFLQKKGTKILSQPIKGTARRITDNVIEDRQVRDALHQSAKDRSENVMVVDLVRNDLSRICEEGTVKVDELYGIYSFPQVHQMISTVSGELRAAVSFADIIKATFPMGSMTGAPKKRVMELIEQYERTRRGIFSGAVGYISPDGDFDFNVVIRSIMYNAAAKYISIQAGSAITFYSDAEKEWDECLLKAEAMKQALSN
jgi:para-aminobenzoate synthetase component I